MLRGRRWRISREITLPGIKEIGTNIGLSFRTKAHLDGDKERHVRSLAEYSEDPVDAEDLRLVHRTLKKPPCLVKDI